MVLSFLLVLTEHSSSLLTPLIKFTRPVELLGLIPANVVVMSSSFRLLDLTKCSITLNPIIGSSSFCSVTRNGTGSEGSAFQSADLFPRICSTVCRCHWQLLSSDRRPVNLRHRECTHLVKFPN